MDSNHYNDELKRRADRRRQILDDIAERQEDLKQCKAEDKADGYSEKALAQCIKELRKGPEYQEKQLSLELELDTYRKALGLPVTVEAAQKAAREDIETLPDDAAERAGARVRGRETVN
mgnify:CR=1 FL=1|jgi:uncharacterized protein (UPF0335 family)